MPISNINTGVTAIDGGGPAAPVDTTIADILAQINQNLTSAKQDQAQTVTDLASAKAGLYGSTTKPTVDNQNAGNNVLVPGKTVSGTLTDPATGDIYTLYSDGSRELVFKGTKAADKTAAGQSAYDLLYSQFNQYGLGSLVADLKNFIVEGLSPAEFLLKLRETPAYQKRFAANTQRIAKGLRALSEAEYIGLEDQYQNIMRQYGLPASYYAQNIDPVTGIKTQPGFEKFIAGDVSASELEDRIQTAQNRIQNAPTQIKDALSQFYGAEISNGDVLAYVLDPDKALPQIKRKITAAEIQGAATMAGLNILGPNATPEQIAAARARATELGTYGVTGEQARQKYQTIAGYLPRASQLADIYAKQGAGPFTQTTAEAEVFGTSGAAEATAKRKKLTELEQAAFSGQAGRAGGALGRERAGQF